MGQTYQIKQKTTIGRYTMNFISVHNDIKKNASYDWLTESQKFVFDKIIDNKVYNFINVYGNSGTGKTFLGWVLQKNGHASYFVDKDEITDNCNIVVIDNGSNSREGYREILRIMELNKIKICIYLTKNKVDDKVFSLKLDFKNSDVDKIEKNLDSIGVSPKNIQSNNLWKLIF